MQKHNILIVDDEPVVLDALGELLGGEYNVFTATNGEDALSIMDQKNIALIIADHRMPGMTGSKLLESVLQKHPNIIRMIISGFIDQNMLMSAINKIHAHGVLIKPWRNEEVRFTVERWIEQYEKLRTVETKVNQSDELQRKLEEANQKIKELTQQLEQSQRLLKNQKKPWYRRS